jgi:hypothetical protein
MQMKIVKKVIWQSLLDQLIISDVYPSLCILETRCWVCMFWIQPNLVPIYSLNHFITKQQYSKTLSPKQKKWLLSINYFFLNFLYSDSPLYNYYAQLYRRWILIIIINLNFINFTINKMLFFSAFHLDLFFFSFTK